jgi:N-methylhydantoinase A
VVGRFHDEHERLYGYCYRDDPRHTVEWVNVRVSGIGPIRRPELTELPETRAAGREAGYRSVCFDEAAWRDTPVYRRTDLSRGDLIDGPAIIEEYGSTLPLHPGFSAETDAYGNLVIRQIGAIE